MATGDSIAWRLRIRRDDGARRAHDRTCYRAYVCKVVPSSWVLWLLKPQWPTDVYHERGAQDFDGRWFAQRRSDARGTRVTKHDAALHRGRCPCTAKDCRINLKTPAAPHY